MRNIKVICPHCEGEFSYRLPYARRMKQLRIRPGEGRFEYTATVDANLLEGSYYTRLDDLILYPIGASIGAAISMMFYSMLDVGSAAYFVSAGASAGLLLTQWWLCDEAVIRRKALRWFRAVSDKWLLDSDKPKPIVLEVDHRYRDGHTETGRTVQYFGALPVPVEVFDDYAKTVLAGETLAIARWTGSGKPFSRQEYERLLDILRQSGAVVNQPGKGNLLTGHGRRALQNHLKQK